MLINRSDAVCINCGFYKMSSAITLLFLIILPASLFATEYLSELIDLSRWKLTLPINTDSPGKPDEITQPQLQSFVEPNYFFINQVGDSVVFRAHCGGITTRGSDYPRCELREMQPNGMDEISWSTDDAAAYTLKMKAAITKTSPIKQHVVCAQIHDENNDVLMIRLEGEKLFIEREPFERVMFNRRYKLGTPFEIFMQSGDGKILVWFNNELKLDWDIALKGCYYKVGCYTQSNVSKGDQPESYGEVILYDVAIQQASKNN